jgi:hypothetical protein
VNGTIKDYEFYLSNDGKDFGQPAKKGTFGEGKEKKTVILTGSKAASSSSRRFRKSTIKRGPRRRRLA